MALGQEHEPLKMFVGGLSWQTKEDSLRNHFSKFGEVVDVEIKNDPASGNPRGFGFVTFRDSSSIEAVNREEKHELDGKVIDPKPATAKNATPAPSHPSHPQSQGLQVEDAKKVFAGGLPPFGPGIENEDILKIKVKATLEEKLRETFPTEPGEFVAKVDVRMDANTERHRGFGFVTFTSEKAAEAACTKRFYQVHGKDVEFKKAEAKHKRVGGGYRGGQQFGYGGGHQAWGGDQHYAGGSYSAGYGAGGSDYNQQQYSMYQQQPYGQHNSYAQQPQHAYGQQQQTGQHGSTGGQMGYDQYAYSSSAQGDSTAGSYGHGYAYGGGYGSHQASHAGYGGQPPQQQQAHQQQYYGHPQPPR